MPLGHDVFNFVSLDARCPHWSTGAHIVNRDGSCKCGRVFKLTEVLPASEEVDVRVRMCLREFGNVLDRESLSFNTKTELWRELLTSLVEDCRTLGPKV